MIKWIYIQCHQSSHRIVLKNVGVIIFSLKLDLTYIEFVFLIISGPFSKMWIFRKNFVGQISNKENVLGNKILWQWHNLFFSRPLPKAGRELQTELDRRMMEGWPLAKNQPEPVTGPWVYTETVYLLSLVKSIVSQPTCWTQLHTLHCHLSSPNST